MGVIQEALPESATREQQILEDVTGLAENMMSGLRRVIADLRPPVLDDLGLVPALRRLGSDLQERAGVAVTVQADEMSGRLPPSVEITLFRVAQEALTNIGKHAHARQARILLRREPGQVTLRISDDGQGLPAHGGLAGAASDWATVYRDGAHFGLLGMQERVALLNGVFRVEDAPQRGTTVSVELPSRWDVNAAPGWREERVTMGVTRVLICDDHAVVRAGLRLILETRPGFVLVGEAANGQEVLAQARQTQPDLVILDLSLPDLTGLAAIPALRQAVPNVKVLVLTVHEDEAYFFTALQAGAAGYMLKGGSANELVAALDLVVQGGVPIPRILGQRLAGDHLGRAATHSGPVGSRAGNAAAHCRRKQ